MKRILFLILLIAGSVSASFAQAPTIQGSGMTITNRTDDALSLSWTRGNGQYCLVVLKPAANPYDAPNSGGASQYTTSSVYGSGANLGSSNFCVYKGTGTSVTVTGLSPSFQYTAVVYEYNFGFSFPSNGYFYNTTTTTGSTQAEYTLCTQPSANVTNLAATPNYTSASVTFTGGNGSYALLSLDDFTDGSDFAYPTDGDNYTASTVYGSGSSLLGNNRVVYNSTGTSFSITNLLPARTYRLRAFEFCGSATGSTYNYLYTSYDYIDIITLNNQPTLNTLSNVTRCQNQGSFVVNLSGISDGSSSETQTMSVTATSSNTTLIPNGNISVSYTNPSSTGSLTITPATNQYGTSTITVTANDGFSSNNTIVRTFVVTVNPFPSAAGSISSSTYVCKNGSNYVFSVPSILNATGYTWSFPSGTVIVSGNNTNSITVNFPAVMTQTSGTVSVYGTNAFGCGNGTQSSKTIYFDVLPTAASAGVDAITCNGTYPLQANQPNSGGSGFWSILSGTASFVNASNYNTNVTSIASGQSVTLNWAISSALGACPVSNDQVIITYNPAAPQCLIFADFFASSTTPCVGATVNFTDNSTGATGWNWNFGPNATPTSSTSQNPSVVFNSSGSQTITLLVTGPNGSDSETKNAYIEVLATPSAAGAISGPTTVCAGEQQQNYSVGAVSGATNYVWTLPANATINSGSGTTAVSVNYATNSTSGQITVAGQNSCGTGTASTLNVTVNPLPGSVGSMTGDNTVCQDENGVAYGVTASTNATGYTWTVPSGANIATNINNNITVDYTNVATSGNVMVFATNGCGNSDTAQVAVTVNPLPGNATVISGPINLTHCPVSTGINYSVPAISDATNYIWTLPTGGTIVNGANTNSVDVDFAFGSTSGNVEVYASNACGNGNAATLAVVFDPTIAQELCLITVNEASDKNVITWEKPASVLIDSFRIYREVVSLGFVHIASIHYDSLSEYVDSAAGVNPNVTAYRYKIAALDNCGNENDLSPFHQTIFLMPPTPSGNDIVIDWDDYIGLPAGFYYRIMRDTAGSGNWQVLDSVIGGVTVYNDVNALNEGSLLSYYIEIGMADICVATRAANHNSTRSNRSQGIQGNGISQTELFEQNTTIYPNPANQNLNISISVSEFKGAKADITDASGRLISSNALNNRISSIDISALAPGIYSITITHNGVTANKRFVKN